MSRPKETDAQIGIEAVPWDVGDAARSLQGLYTHDTNFTREKVKYYKKDAEWNGTLARLLRTFAVITGTVGLVMPLVAAAIGSATVNLAPWGYVAVAVAAGLFSIDRVGGYLWRWTRSTIIWTSLRRELADFQHEWSILTDSGATMQKQLEELQKFRRTVEDIIAKECREWADMTLAAHVAFEQKVQRNNQV